MDLTKLLLHPVRLRIVFATMDGVPFTTSEMILRMPDVSKATMYRQLALRTEGELLEVESEDVVRGIVERHYRLVRVRAVIDPDTAAGMTKDNHRRGFAAATTSLIAGFNAYLDRPGSNPTADSVSYCQFPLWLSGAERATLIKGFTAVIQRHSKHRPSTDRKRHLLATVFSRAAPDVTAWGLVASRQIIRRCLIWSASWPRKGRDLCHFAGHLCAETMPMAAREPWPDGRIAEGGQHESHLEGRSGDCPRRCRRRAVPAVGRWHNGLGTVWARALTVAILGLGIAGCYTAKSHMETVYGVGSRPRPPLYYVVLAPVLGGITLVAGIVALVKWR